MLRTASSVAYLGVGKRFSIFGFLCSDLALAVYYICWSGSAYQDKLCKNISGKTGEGATSVSSKSYTF